MFSLNPLTGRLLPAAGLDLREGAPRRGFHEMRRQILSRANVVASYGSIRRTPLHATFLRGSREKSSALRHTGRRSVPPLEEPEGRCPPGIQAARRGSGPYAGSGRTSPEVDEPSAGSQSLKGERTKEEQMRDLSLGLSTRFGGKERRTLRSPELSGYIATRWRSTWLSRPRL